MSETDALIMRGMLRVYLDDLGGAIADLGVAAARIRTGLPASYPVPCLAHLSDAHLRHGDWDAANTYAQLATSLAQDVDRPADLARAHARAAQILSLRGQWSIAQSHVKAAREASQRSPLALAVANAAVAAASFATARNDPAGVLAAIEPVRAQGMLEVGGLPGMFNWRALEADALIGLGRLDDAMHALDEFEAAVPGGGLPSAALALARCRGNLAVATGDAGQAQLMFERAHSLEPPCPCPSNAPSSASTMAGACAGSTMDPGRSLSSRMLIGSSRLWGPTPTSRSAPQSWPLSRSPQRPRALPHSSGSAERSSPWLDWWRPG